MHYYNEHDPKAAAWLRELIRQKLIPAGEVDERSIADVRGRELLGFRQCHFFCGLAGWVEALRLAGWPEDRPVWTGSCPCQPFSAAGKQKGFDDERHLWPVFHRLIEECRPSAVFGEQVASRLGREWLAGVRSDLEDVGYEVGAADLCAAGVGAPHIRQRLYWVAYREDNRRNRGESAAKPEGRHVVEAGGAAGGLGDSRYVRRRDRPFSGGPELHEIARHGFDGRMDDPERTGSQGCGFTGDSYSGDECRKRVGQSSTSGGAGFWHSFDLLPCRDGKARRVESGTFPLAHGVPARVVRLRGYGNAIVPPLAAEFVKACEAADADRHFLGLI